MAADYDNWVTKVAARMSHPLFRLLLLAACVFSALAPRAWGAEPAEGIEFFEKKVRPILAEKCYSCHSAQAKQLQGGLRLDSKPGWQRGGDSGEVISPGKPEESRFIESIRWTDPDFQMPPDNRLTAAQVAALVEWVKRGAPDPREKEPPRVKPDVSASYAEKANHWSYLPPKKTAPPAVKNSAWSRSEIDHFLLAALEAEKLAPAADADRATLARRIYFDLTGLPPTPAEIDAFVNDVTPDAFERLVDRLLASPRFGEQWARHWFDVARYAESVTLRGFIFREAWRYRDYAIESFNQDAPFDRFIREQIAGDLLPHESLDERRRNLIAVTFLMMGNTNLEEQDKKQLEMDVVDEQLDTLGKAFLAQTIGCARCHDHKFDPIPTRDYYALAGILKNSKSLKHANVSEWLEAPLPVEPQEEQVYARHEAVLAGLASEIKAAKDKVKLLAGKTAEPKTDSKQPAKASVVAVKDLAGIVVDSSSAKAVGTWKHSQYSKHYIGDGYLHDDAAGKGEKTLTFQPELTKPGKYEVRFAYIHSPSRSQSVPVTIFHAEGETTVMVDEQDPPPLDGRFVSLGQFRFEGNGFGHVLVENEGTKGHVTADAVQFLPLTDGEKPVAKAAPAAEPKTAEAVASAEAAQNLKALEARLEKLKKSGPKRPMTMLVHEAEKIEDTPIHIRGSVHNLGAIAPRGYLSVAAKGPVPEIPEKESGRRELAEWIASETNPLTARVIVNRVWQKLFGEGLVRSIDNFGTTGEVPSHPELLDHLALQFVEQGWSIKQLVRELVLTRAYQMSTATSEAALAADPDNRLLAHMPRRRLTAENIRDAMLAISGELKLETGGPTFPPDRASDFNFEYNDTRRSVYVPVFRNALPEIFDAFDFAAPSMVVGKRNVSTVPTQALLLLNSPWVRERARTAARQDVASTEDERLQNVFRRTLGRPPTDAERQLALARLKEARDSKDRLEAWTDVVQTLFASIDFRYIN
jgi:hypothetical protein